MEDLYHSQIQLQQLINQLKANFKKDSRDRKTSEYIKKKLFTLDTQWEEFNNNDEKLREFNNPNHAYFFNNLYDETYQAYVEARKLIQQSTPPTTTPAEVSIPRNVQPKPTSRHSPKPNTSEDTLPASGGDKNHHDEKSSFISQGNNSKLDEMLRKQSSNFKALARTLANIKLDSVGDKWELEDLLKSLDSRWAAIDSLHWEIDSELSGTDEDYENTFTKYENEHAAMKKLINSKLWSTSHREKSTPLLDIPVFHGHYQQWVSFKDLFTEAIHSNPCLSNAQKMQFLKSKIKGEPERLIQHLPISSENYTTCWEILNYRYHNKKLIFTTHINNVMTLPVMQQATSSHIKRLHDITIESLNGIKNLGVNIDTWDPLLVHLLQHKLDTETHNEYMTALKQPRDLPMLKEFLSFLEGKFTAMESSRRKQEAAVNRPNLNTPSTSNNQHKTSRFNFITNKATTSQGYHSHGYQRKCPVCQQDHGIYFCTEFKDMAPGLKRKTITKLNLCSNCLYKHNGKPCHSIKRCQQCNGYHNTLLHEVFHNQNATSIDTSGAQPRQECGSHVAQQRENNNQEPNILLATALIKILGNDGVPRTMRALVDQGSQICLISENAAQQLGLPRQKVKRVITGVGANDNISKGMLNLNCLTSDEKYSFNTEAFIMKTVTRNLPNHTFPKPRWDLLNTLPLADSKFHVSNSIDILLGAEIYASILLEGILKDENSPLVAQNTRLGWIVSGKVHQGFHCNLVLNSLEDIQKFWEIEDIPEHTPNTSEEDECIKYYKATTTRLADGRYQVRIPLKDGGLKRLGHSKNKAVMQFRQLEYKFSRNDHIAQQYKLFIHEYLSLGHMVLAPTQPWNKTRECYLPHHSVLRDDSTTSALRVVFNGSSRTSTGVSLNDIMHKGPNLQKDLLSLILKWRQHRVAYIADVEKMFRQIWVHEEDQSLQKIIWRSSSQEMLQEYQLATVSYGQKAAPFLAMMTLKQLAHDERTNYPEATQALEECFYMDDLLHGSHSVSSAKQLQQDLQKLLQSGGFHLRKWMSNHQGLTNIKNQDALAENNYNFKEVESRKTLGLQWDPSQDLFHFESKLEAISDVTKDTSKRQLLSEISRLFDPLGWLTPISTKLKLLYQLLWKTPLQWDDKIPSDIQSEWIAIKQDINNNINTFKIQRWIGTGAVSDIELHAFSDATPRAYACVIYCKINMENHSKIILLAGKSRLVPSSKNISLPKLELCGTHLVAKLMIKVKQCLTNHNIKVFGWVDSTAVLGWLQGDPNRWNTFVVNRVRQITEVIPPDCWRYVKSAENPSDCASRGLTASQLKQHPLWWNGPTWLASFKAEDQDKPVIYNTNEERKNIQVNIAVESKTEENIIDQLINKYSSLSKLVRVLAWVRRFITRRQDRKTGRYLNLSELNETKAMIVKRVQFTEFQDEYQDLKKCGSISSKSNILDLSPFMDEKGILRVKGRLRHAYIAYDMKHPIILPHRHRLTSLIIDHAHKMVLHGGARITLNFIRNKYWIVGGNSATKQIIHRCVTCKKQKEDLPKLDRKSPARDQVVDQENLTRSPQKPSAKKAGLTLSSMFAALLLFLSCLSTGQCNVNIIPFRETQGLYFDKLADMMLIRDEWKLIVYYNMAPYWEATNAFQKYNNFLKETCETIKTEIHCDILLLQLRHGFSELEYYNQMLLSQHASTRHSSQRYRRGLIDGVGYLANSLFGVLDERFAEQYQKDISLLRDNTKHMASLWKNQTSVVEAEYNLLKRTEETVSQQHKMIHQHMMNLEEAFKNMKHKVETTNIINDFNLGATIASNMLHNLKGMQNVLLDTITDTYHGRFNLHLLTPEQLINELSTIASTLPRDVSLPVDNLHTDLRKIYDLLKVKTRMLEDVLIFEIRLPLISRDVYELLRIVPIPRKDGIKMTTILPVSDYVSINMKKDMYIPISEGDVRACSLLSDAYFCYLKKPVYQLKGDDSLCETDKLGCKTVTTTCKNNWLESNALNTYIYFCCEQCQVRTLCADQVTAHQLTNAGLINIGHGCLIKTDTFSVFPHKPHWSEIKMKPEMYNPVMAPINHVINITIPQLKEKNESRDLQRETDKLGEKIEQLKNSEIISENISYHDIHHYAMIYVILGGIGAVSLFLIIRRVQWRVPPTQPIAVCEQLPTAALTAPRAVPRSVAVETRQHGSEDCSETTNPLRVDKATSPKFKVVTFH